MTPRGESPRSWAFARGLISKHVHKSKIAGVFLGVVGALALQGGVAQAGMAQAGAGAQGEVVCTVDDPRAIELSGLVATPQGFVAIVDSQFDSDQVVIVRLDQQCGVASTTGYPTPPRDPEDLAVAPDGALWVADIGDNITAANRRETVALWRIPPDGGPPVIHRLAYPDGPHDAEALLFAADGSPIIITKEVGDTAYLYQATGALQPGTPQGAPLRLVGEFRPVVTGAPNDLSTLGELMVTGAASAPDRSRVALRTYTAAYEWSVPDGDVVRAITTTPPRITPLPDETQGEAIAYTVDGTGFLTVEDVAGPTPIRRYQPSTVEHRPSATAPPGEETAADADPVTTPIVWYGFALVGGGAALLLGAGGWVIARRVRRRHGSAHR